MDVGFPTHSYGIENAVFDPDIDGTFVSADSCENEQPTASVLKREAVERKP